MNPISNLETLLRSMQPVLNAEVFVYVCLPIGSSIPEKAIATFCETEGITVILEKSIALQHKFEFSFECAWISLTVHSSLEAVGLTAAFSSALGEAGIACNVMAGFYHDHIFVPVHQAEAAMQALLALTKK